MNRSRELTSMLKRLARHVNCGVLLNRATGPALVAVGLVAAAHLALKMLAPQYAHFALWGLALVPAGLALAWADCVRRKLFFCTADVAEVADHLHKNDGLIAAAFERPELIPSADIEQSLGNSLARRFPRFNARHYARRVSPAIAFAAIAIMIPPRQPAAAQQRQEVLDAITQPLADQLESGKDILTDEQRADIQKDLQQVKESDQGVSKEQWEAVEEIQKRIEDVVKQNEASVTQISSSLNEISAMVEGSGADSSSLGLTPLQQARVDKLSQDLTLRGLNPKTPLSAEQRTKLSQMLKQCKGGQCDKKGLCEGLCKLAKECESKCQKNGDGKCVGSGGRDRGRGDAPYVLGDKKTLDGAKYDDKQVENKYLSNEDLVDLGITPVEPRPDPGKFSPGAVKEFAATEGSQVSRTRISPSQKDVISKYFGK